MTRSLLVMALLLASTAFAAENECRGIDKSNACQEQCKRDHLSRVRICLDRLHDENLIQQCTDASVTEYTRCLDICNGSL